MKKDSREIPLDQRAIRASLEELQGRQFWQSLEELAEREESQGRLSRQCSQQASTGTDSMSRRTFLGLMAASLALAGLGGCGPGKPPEKILPYVRQPEEIVPGRPLFFATAMPLSGYALGLLAESHMGRPTKIEGNPQHPASLGGTDALAQASVLSLYDPDRSQTVLHQARISTWDAFLAAMTHEMEAQRSRQGAGLRILTETVTSPTLAAQIRALLQKFPSAQWHPYEPIGLDNLHAGARLAFGEPVNTLYRFDRAKAILALDADFLSSWPGSVRYAHDLMEGRRVRKDRLHMSRLYVVESTPTLAGALADHRWPLRASQVEGFARAVAGALGLQVGPASGLNPSAPPIPWIPAIVRDLQNHRGATIVLAGEGQPPIVHALAHGLNQLLGNVGNTVIYTDPVEVTPEGPLASLRRLVGDMAAGRVDTLVILGGNPAYTAPADLRFAEQLSKVGLRIHLSPYADETSALCHWHIPEVHYLETWSDARAFDGTVTVLQPLIDPLYHGRSAHELLAVLLGEVGHKSYDIVRRYWQGQTPSSDFEAFWQRALHDGLIDGSQLPGRPVSLRADFTGQSAPSPSPPTSGGTGLEIIFRPDPHVWDGRFANNAWLQELPKPLTTLTWDNAALISPTTARRLGLSNEEVVELRYRGRVVRAPIWVMAGHCDDAVTMHLGYGRTRAGRVGTGAGFNAYALRTSDAPWFGSGLEIRKTGERYPLAVTQEHSGMVGRDLVRAATLKQFRAHPGLVQEGGDRLRPSQVSLYPEYPYTGHQWGMAIDQNLCIGCNACVVACQAENNIPIVGKSEVLRNREMHWLKIDRYYHGDPGNPKTYFQPRPCMHCEKAPCEVVCPVEATVHDDEGLNEMIYNRCVGTRYCSNNCPYKVRRFNFFQNVDKSVISLQLMRNPDVTVRERGVMEKCTYCIQRISTARREAEKENREVREGEVLTACQQACPTQAIVFGNINDPNSAVARLKAEPHNYDLLAELNTQPRTTYLAVFSNPNPEIKDQGVA